MGSGPILPGIVEQSGDPVTGPVGDGAQYTACGTYLGGGGSVGGGGGALPEQAAQVSNAKTVTDFQARGIRPPCLMRSDEDLREDGASGRRDYREFVTRATASFWRKRDRAASIDAARRRMPSAASSGRMGANPRMRPFVRVVLIPALAYIDSGIASTPRAIASRATRSSSPSS